MLCIPNLRSHKISPNTRALVWNLNTAGLPTQSVYGPPIGGVSPLVSPDGSVVYIQHQAGTYSDQVNLTAMNASDGSVIWSIEVLDPDQCSGETCSRGSDPVLSPDGTRLYTLVNDPLGTGSYYVSVCWQQ